MDASLKQGRRAVAAVLALMLAGTSFGSVAAFAQDAAPGGFSLPAGTPAPQQQPPSDVQGPVDNGPDQPRRADEPAQTAPAPTPPSVAPVQAPKPAPKAPRPQAETARKPATPPRAQRAQGQPSPAPARPTEAIPAPAAQPNPAAGSEPVQQAPAATPPAATPLPVPDLPGLPAETPAPDTDAAEGQSDGSTWWWLTAGIVALISLLFMARRPRKDAATAPVTTPVAPTATVPTPPLRQPPAAPKPAPAPAPAQQPPRPAPQPAPQPPRPAPTPEPTVPFEMLQGSKLGFGIEPTPSSVPAASTAPSSEPEADQIPAQQPPRLLLDFTTLGVDVTLVNAVARYHLAITNMADIPVSKVVLHGAIVQARRGMPPTIDPLRGDSLLPMLQKVSDIPPDGTQRCEGQIRLPLDQIEPIEMQGRMLFVPVVHIWIGYSGPDGTRYAVTQSFVVGEESSPPGPRVGPLRLDLGPRRFTEVGQRPLQPE